MNLLDEKWLPVKRRSGQRDWIAPHQLAEPDILAFDAPRADFNGALAQFAIGLLQTATHIDDESEWGDLYDAPPNAQDLQLWFKPLVAAFEFDGEGARFMQDFEMRAEGAECTADALLIDAAGSSSLDKNVDHFVKRNTVNALCPHCAATALLTLQTNAPAGGAGHRTSLRGGGPLTTLLIATPAQTLWHDLWLNVRPRPNSLRMGGDATKSATHFTFPWLAPVTAIQSAGGETQPLQVHPHHVYWAMPRRIRLDLTADAVCSGVCDLCKRSSAELGTTLIQRYFTKPQGLNYKGVWRHPFSPYYETKEGWLPVHPQPGGFSYRHWLSWIMGSTHNKKQVEAASTVGYAKDEHRQVTKHLRLWVFGFDMDNMKARCWYETRFPLYDLTACKPGSHKHIRTLLQSLLEASELAVFYLRSAVRDAWFSADAKGDFSFIDKAFWDASEFGFYLQVQALLKQARSESGVHLEDSDFLTAFGENWLQHLRECALQIFDQDMVGTGSIAQQNPRRIAEAYHGLHFSFDGRVIRTVLHLPEKEKKAKSGKVSLSNKKSSETQLPLI